MHSFPAASCNRLQSLHSLSPSQFVETVARDCHSSVDATLPWPSSGHHRTSVALNHESITFLHVRRLIVRSAGSGLTRRPFSWHLSLVASPPSSPSSSVGAVAAPRIAALLAAGARRKSRSSMAASSFRRISSRWCQTSSDASGMTPHSCTGPFFFVFFLRPRLLEGAAAAASGASARAQPNSSKLASKTPLISGSMCSSDSHSPGAANTHNPTRGQCWVSVGMNSVASAFRPARIAPCLGE
mmetsp:Transcript_42162/g.106134  ORF Transcript_42162/g.106134 Transcript_42162/m.106134 type:complete len:242 (+) Transcript_42162:176-901(+)